MKYLLILLHCVPALRFREMSSNRSHLKVEKVSESWCAQFPYCPTGCSLFCTPTETVAPGVPKAALPSPTNYPSSRHNSHSRHSSQRHRSRQHHRRRKEGKSDFVKKVANVVKSAITLKLGASVTTSPSELRLLNTNSKFRKSVKKSLAKQLKLSLEDAEEQIVNLVIELKKDKLSSFVQIVQIATTQDLLIKFGVLVSETLTSTQMEEFVEQIQDRVNIRVKDDSNAGKLSTGDAASSDFLKGASEAIIEDMAEEIPSIKENIKKVLEEVEEAVDLAVASGVSLTTPPVNDEEVEVDQETKRKDGSIKIVNEASDKMEKEFGKGGSQN